MAQKQTPEAPPAQAGFPNAHDILIDAPIGVFTSTPEGKYLSVNQALARMHGYSSPEEMIASITDIATQVYVDPADRDEFKRLLKEHGEVVDHECRLKRKDGAIIWVSSNARVMKDNEGRIVAYQGFTTDITNRKGLEEQYRGIFEASKDAMLIFDMDGVIREVNQAACAIYGYTHDEMIGLSGKDIVHPDFQHLFKYFVRKAAKNETFFAESRDIRKDGSTFDIEVKGGALQFRNRPHLLAVVRDITERKQDQTTMERSRYSLDMIIDSVFWVDEAGNFLDVNEAACRNLGYSRDELLIMGVADVDPHYPSETWPHHWEEMKRRKVMTIESTHQTKDGRLFPVELIIHHQQFGNTQYNCVLARDITERKRVEEALINSEELLKAVVDSAQDSIFVKDSLLRYIKVNAAMESLFGINAKDILGKSDSDLFGPDFANHIEEIDKKVLMGNVIEEYPCKPVNGQEHYFHAIKVPLKNKHGQITGLCGIARDITERKLAEEALRESEGRYRTLFERTVNPIMVIDAKGNYIDANKAALEFLECTRDELLEKNVVDFKPPGRDIVMKEHISAWESGGVLETQYFVKGKVKTLILNITPGTWLGQPIVFGNGMDITERKQMERELRESWAKMQAITDSAQDAIIMVGPDGEIVYWNPMAETILGYTADEAMGEDLHYLLAPERYHEDHKKAFPEFQRTGQGNAIGKTLELAALRKDGMEISISLSLSSVSLQGKWHAVGIVRDISYQKMAEAALVSAKEQAEVANQAKSEFLANMSHEIRTPINGIMGMMQLLETTTLDADQRQYVQLCTSAAERLTRLLSDILDLSRVEAGKMTIHEAEFMVQELGDSVSGLFSYNARTKGLALDCSIDSSMPPKLVGDEARVRQILFNLVGNALKFTDKGRIRVAMTRLESGMDDSVNVLFTIADTGIGIPEDKVKHLFDPFFQVEESYTRSFQGAGLGLSIVQRLVEMMGGKISVASEVGEGTTVNVLLPFKLPERVGVATQQGSVQLAQTKQSLRILLAEDEESNAMPIVKLLEKAGHAVTLAKDGQQALDLLAAQDFDVILMDVQMPVMNGVEATKAIRSSTDLGPKKDIPIIALTAYAMTGDREKILEAGMNDYLAKPVKMEDLGKVLERVVVQG